MPWVLAHHSRSKSRYIKLRLRELELHIIAERINGPQHFLAIVAQDSYEQLITLCKFDTALAMPAEWVTFYHQHSTRAITPQDEEDLREFLKARPYKCMQQHRGTATVDFTLFGARTTNHPDGLSSHATRGARKTLRVKKPLAGITPRRAIPAIIHALPTQSPRRLVPQIDDHGRFHQLGRKSTTTVRLVQQNLPHQEP